MSISPSFAVDTVKKPSMPISKGNTLYVGGSGGGNYTTIQDAIDNASDGDTVFVFNGTYHENIEVDKSINLIGEDKKWTVIDGINNLGDVVFITANSVNISGFSIKHSGYGERDAGIKIQSKNNKVFGNIHSGNEVCIYVESSIGNNISSNELMVRDYGIILNGSEANNIYNNYIRMIPKRDSGIGLFSSSNNNIVSRNTIVNGGGGIIIDGDNNDINNNIMLNIFSSCVIISGNNNLIYKNNISAIYDGINIVRGSKNNNVYENDIKSIQCGVDLIGVKKNNIHRNNIIGCIRGVNLRGAKNNNIHRNNIIECNDGLFYSEYSFRNRIYENNFIDNINHGNFIIYRIEIPLIILLRNKWDRNYWGEPLSSPKVIKGWIVRSYVHYPWYTKLYPGYQFDWNPAKEPYNIEGVI